MRRIIVPIAVFFCSVISISSQADELDADEIAAIASADRQQLDALGPVRAQDVLPDVRLAPTVEDLYGQNDVTAYGAVAELTASNQNSQNSLKLLMQNRSGSPVFDGSGKMTWDSSLTSWSLVFSAPFNMSAQSSPGAIATASLPSAFQAKLGFSNLLSHMRANHRTMASLGHEALDACIETRTKFIRMDAAKKAKQECEKLTFADLIDKYLPGQRNAFEAASAGSAYIYGGSASAGYSNFSFYELATAVKGSETHVPWSVTGFAGISPTGDALLILGSLSYQDIFYGEPTGTLCPSGSGGIVSCVTGALGPPKELKQTLVSLEPRAQFPLKGPFGVNSIGIDPKFSYDVENGIYGFETRVTLGQISPPSSGSTPPLSAGLDFGWQSDKHVFVAGLFIGAPFSLYDQ